MAAQDRSIWKFLTSQAAGAEMHDADMIMMSVVIFSEIINANELFDVVGVGTVKVWYQTGTKRPQPLR